MTKSIYALFWVTILAGQSSHVMPPHVYAGRTGLTLIALGQDGFALAADGAQSNADGTISEVQKIFPLGKTGAVVLAGQVSVQDSVSRPVREEFNAARITELWLNAHHDATFDTAGRDLRAVVLQAANSFFSKRNPGSAAGTYKFALVFLDCKDGEPALSGTRYFMPGGPRQPMRTESITASTLHPGEIWIFGLVKTTQELLAGNSAALKKYKAEPALAKLRNSPQPSAQDFLSAFDIVLEAAESPDGRKFDPGTSVIAPPNRFATITTNGGFSSGKK